LAEFEDAPDGPAPEAPIETSSAAVALALGRGSKASKALDAKAATFLDEQTRLVRLQTEHLHEQRELVLSRLRWGRFGDRLKALLQIMTVLVGLAIVALIGVMAWQAHETSGLVIDAFSVPPDLARDGLTGQVAAGRFLDKLQVLQAATANSERPAQSFQDDWGSEIKVEIPETGLTFGEFEKLLREKLGHIRHVSGEVLRTPGGISLTARIGDAPPQTFEGAEADFDALAQKAAEAVYRASQPYRYADYLDQHGRAEEAFAVVADLAANGPPSERGWAYAKWALMDVNDHGDVASAAAHASRGLGFGAGSDMIDRISLVAVAVWSGHDEDNLHVSRAIDLNAQRRLPDTSTVFYEETKLLSRAWLQFSEPDFGSSADSWRKTTQLPGPTNFTSPSLGHAMAATALALDHDPAGARAELGLVHEPDEAAYMWDIAKGAFPAAPAYWIAAETGDWPAALANARHLDAWLAANKVQRPIYGLMQASWIWPLEAMALARTGDLKGAQALIEATPLDCYPCLRVRARIAAAAHDWPAAERWFTEAARLAPSLPFAYAEWGQVRLDRGDADGAIAELALAHARAPGFADPLELWGEALMRKGDFEGAADRFRQADGAAPRWGLNHLHWGQALARLGRTAEADKQRREATPAP
jgi:tetratricopeptide (TPR) repeat protein